MDRQSRQAGSEEACRHLARLEAEIRRIEGDLAGDSIPELLNRVTLARRELDAVACALVRDRFLAAVAGKPSMLEAPGDAIHALGRLASPGV